MTEPFVRLTIREIAAVTEANNRGSCLTFYAAVKYATDVSRNSYPDGWVPVSGELCKRFGLTPKQAKNSRQILEAAGLIESLDRRPKATMVRIKALEGEGEEVPVLDREDLPLVVLDGFA